MGRDPRRFGGRSLIVPLAALLGIARVKVRNVVRHPLFALRLRRLLSAE